MWPSRVAPSEAGGAAAGFLYADALSDDTESELGLEEAEAGVAESARVEVDEDLYTNVVLSMLSGSDSVTTKLCSVLLILLVAFLQVILAFAIYKHVQIAMSWTSSSVRARSLRNSYSDLLHEARLAYIRLELEDVREICGDFDYNLVETGLQGTNWTSYFEYEKVPVNDWHAWRIPPTDRSLIDEARYVMENDQYIYVYIIVTFMWMLSIIYDFRRIFQLFLALMQMPVPRHRDDPVLRQDGDEYEILALTYPAKLMGLACVLYRIVINSAITCVGCQFLLWTTTNIELILNALALTFVLELDQITYKAAISTPRQNLISKLKGLSWHDPPWCRSVTRNRSLSKITMVLFVLGTAGTFTYGLRRVQFMAYMEVFTVAASLCLFQGPTPGYWSQFRATFPVPGFCETVLQLRCEAPIVGEEGVSCVENWNQRLCKFYLKTDSLFSTWDSIDWVHQGACIAFHHGVATTVPETDLGSCGLTHRILGETCISMWQRRPQVEFRSKERADTGPRLRVYPYQHFLPAAPFWCRYFDGSEAVLQPEGPVKVRHWRKLLRNCEQTRLVYTGGHGQGAMQGTGSDEVEADSLDNMTEATGIFSGVWLSPKMGVVVIENKGVSAKVTNALLPFSPVPARVNIKKKTLKFLKDPYYSCKLEDDGKISMSNGDVLVNQKTEMEKTKPKARTDGRPPFFLWLR